MARALDKELLEEAFNKTSGVDVEGWCNQVGLDFTAFFEQLVPLALHIVEKMPIMALFLDEDKVTDMLSAFAVAFEMGWFARALQKEDVV